MKINFSGFFILANLFPPRRQLSVRLSLSPSCSLSARRHQIIATNQLESASARRLHTRGRLCSLSKLFLLLVCEFWPKTFEPKLLGRKFGLLRQKVSLGVWKIGKYLATILPLITIVASRQLILSQDSSSSSTKSSLNGLKWTRTASKSAHHLLSCSWAGCQSIRPEF